MVAKIARRQFTVDEYYRMGTAGILSEDDRVELLDGEIVEMPPIGSFHAGVVDRLTRLLSRRLGDDVIVRVQNPVRLNDFSEPQPDLTLLRSRDDFYTQSHPGPDDVLLLIEVADSSLDYDREVKLPLYARAGVPEVWIVDLGAGAVETYASPSANGYQAATRAARGDRIVPSALPGVQVAVADILG